MRDVLLKHLREQDTFAAIEHLEGLETVAALTAYHDLARYLYWQEKDLNSFVLVARAGIQRGLSAAAAATPDFAARLKADVKGLAYDVAAHTWPGWDEPGIVIDSFHLAIGMDAARTNLRLAKELAKPDLPMSRAYWVLGAQQIAAGDYAGARASFEEAAGRAHRAHEAADELLNRGFAWLAETLPGAARLDDERFRRIERELLSSDQGRGFRDQIATAARVFAPSGAA